ncbi:MAG: dihydroorotase, partial [Flavobacterium sp.]
DVVIEKLTAARSVFGLQSLSIQEGAAASFTLFNPEGNSTFTEADVLSKSKNSAFFGQSLKGKAYGIYNNGKLVLNAK